jgi:hypothetical protein
MNPSTSLRPGCSTSIIATVLLSALATARVRPSGDTDSAFGVVPGGASGNGETPICSRAVSVAVSTTHTLFVFAQATNSRWPSFDDAIAFGCAPTATSPVTASVAASSASTLAPPHSDTKTRRPSLAGTTV